MLFAYLQYAFFFLVVFLLVMTYYNWKNSKAVVFLLLFFLIYLFENIMLAALIYSKHIPFYPVLFYNFTPLYYLKAPALYFFVRGVFNSKLKFKGLDFLHLIPFFYKIIDIIPYYLTSYSYKAALSSNLLQNYHNISNVNLFSFISPVVEVAIRNSQLIFYIVLSFIVIFKSITLKINTPELKVKAHKQLKIWLIILLSIIAFITIVNSLFNLLYTFNADFLYTNMVLNFFFNAALMMYVYIPVLFITFPKLIYGVTLYNYHSIDEAYATQEQVTGADKNWQLNLTEDEIVAYNSLCDSISMVLESNKPFLNPNFQMSDLAALVNAPKYQIQFCLNSIMNVKFADLKNKCRVEYALELLKSNKNLTLEAVGVNSGFASNSNFYTAFKLITGETPSQWIKKTVD